MTDSEDGPGPGRSRNKENLGYNHKLEIVHDNNTTVSLCVNTGNVYEALEVCWRLF